MSIIRVFLLCVRFFHPDKSAYSLRWKCAKEKAEWNPCRGESSSCRRQTEKVVSFKSDYFIFHTINEASIIYQTVDWELDYHGE